MPRNKGTPIKDFIIKSGIEAVLNSAHCEIKHNRTPDDLIEYLRYVPLEKQVDLRKVILDYFTSEDLFPFEIVREIHQKEEEKKQLENSIDGDE